MTTVFLEQPLASPGSAKNVHLGYITTYLQCVLQAPAPGPGQCHAGGWPGLPGEGAQWDRGRQEHCQARLEDGPGTAGIVSYRSLIHGSDMR